MQELRNRLIHKKDLSPRFIISLFNQYVDNFDFDEAINNTVEDYFEKPSNLIIASDNQKFRIIPTLKIEPFQIQAPSGLHFSTIPYIIIPNVKTYWNEQLELFENLLNDSNVKEKDFQSFFEKHPNFLKGIDYKSVIPHPILERDNDGDLIPDFFLQPLNSELADIWDLKLPKVELIVGRKDRQRFSQSVYETTAQLREYRDYFENKKYRELIKKKYGITAYKPNVVAVIGRSPADVDEIKFRQISDSLPSYFKIITYDDLHEKMKIMVEKNMI